MYRVIELTKYPDGLPAIPTVEVTGQPVRRNTFQEISNGFVSVINSSLNSTKGATQAKGVGVVGDSVVGDPVLGACVVGERLVGPPVVGVAVEGACVIGVLVVGLAVIGAGVGQVMVRSSTRPEVKELPEPLSIPAT